MPQDDDSDSILPRICDDSLSKCQVVEIPTSTSLSPRPTHGHINSGATVADDKVEFKFTMDEGSESRLSNASSLSVYAGYASGHSKAEALDVVNVGDLEKHDYDWTMVTTIAVIRSWRAHAILLMIFVRLPLSCEVPRGLTRMTAEWSSLGSRRHPTFIISLDRLKSTPLARMHRARFPVHDEPSGVRSASPAAAALAFGIILRH
jgi:hypothetical protein